MQAGDARANEIDGRMDGGSHSEGKDGVRPTAVAENDLAAADAAPGSVAQVEVTPGVEVLRAIAAEAPEWTITHAGSLADQGQMVTGLLLEGYTPQEVRHALLSRPLPRPLDRTVGAVVSRRLRDLLEAGPASGVRPIPAQRPESVDRRGWPEQEAPTPTPPSFAERQAQLHAAVSGQDRHRLCEGDPDCPRLALPGLDRCAVCLGGESPVCAGGCGRGVMAPGSWCLICATPAPEPDPGECPGHDGGGCGRAVVTQGLCGRCKIAAEQARRAADEEWEQARDAAVKAAEAART
ncbi:hypothetical protein AB0K09_28035 [Streptomyces sp. NPDC049577]|uniref:hypothetical protein n=1 Tax=Streptomyces sp. NPDC049577 TaxID=3155153 RepID=UPI00343F1049